MYSRCTLRYCQEVLGSSCNLLNTEMGLSHSQVTIDTE